MLVSIIVPVYNSEDYLDECIKSITNQTYLNWELVLVNDGSTDNSEVICCSYANSYPNISYYKKDNGGVSSARNYGIEHAKGDFITFVDSDDYLDRNCLRFLTDHLCSSEVSMVVGGLKYHSTNGKEELVRFRLQSGSYSVQSVYKALIDDGSLSGFTFHSSCAILYNLNYIKEKQIRFNEQLKFNEDGLFTTEYCLKNSHSRICVDFSQGIYIYRYNAESASKNIDIDRYIRDMQSIERILCNYTIENINEQLLYRKVTVVIDLFGIYRRQGSLTYRFVKQSLRNDEIELGIRLLPINQQRFSKKMLCMLLKKRRFLLVYILFQLHGLYNRN